MDRDMLRPVFMDSLIITAFFKKIRLTKTISLGCPWFKYESNTQPLYLTLSNHYKEYNKKITYFYRFKIDLRAIRRLYKKPLKC